MESPLQTQIRPVMCRYYSEASFFPDARLIWVRALEIKSVMKVEDKSQFSRIRVPCLVKLPKGERPGD